MDCYEALLPPEYKNSKMSEGALKIGVYSPIRRCMKTSFCLVLGMILAESQKVIYLNLEEMSGLEQILIRYIADKEAVNMDNFVGLIQELEKEKHYDVIIIDVADGGPSLNGVLKICKKIYMPICNDWISKSKIEEFERVMEIIGEQDILKRIEKLELPQLDNPKSDQSYEEQLLWGELGDYVRNLTR